MTLSACLRQAGIAGMAWRYRDIKIQDFLQIVQTSLLSYSTSRTRLEDLLTSGFKRREGM